MGDNPTGVYIFILIIGILFITSSQVRATDKSTVSSTSVRPFFNFLFLVLLIYLATFRSRSVGTDYSMYNGFFSMTNQQLKAIYIEKGYLLIYSIARWVNDFRVVPFISFLLFFTGLYKFSKEIKMSTEVLLGFLVCSYLYCNSLNGIRQMSAIGVVFFALSLYLNVDILAQHRWLNIALYIFIIYIASLFHASAWFAIALPLIKYVPISSIWVVLGGLLTGIGFFTKFISGLMPKLVFLFPHYVEKHDGANSAFFVDPGSKGIIEFLPILIQFIFLFLICYYSWKFVKLNKFITAGYFAYLFLFIGGGNFTVTRVQAYLLPFLVFFYGKYVQESTENIARLRSNWFKVIIVLFFSFYFVFRLSRNISGIVPFVLG
ncbi:EpsG family protein [Loigolactobacillus jiayinensis]|uniref:EpsG family protein n=1 Tax=Loigolactobacillus jiayinensis TaxID=2486016 RepID=A0ABW1RC45_9LACO|nr:EpsG family protein [Loigolactobacillus jiayinensis]